MKMTPAAGRRASSEARLEDFLGRVVRAENNHPVGRLEEFRADLETGHGDIAGYVIGFAGLADRLGLGLRLLSGRGGARGYFVRSDQMDVSDPQKPRLRCPVEQLEQL
jgi:hypothetical protein